MTLKETVEILREAGIESAEYDAKELFRAFAKLDTGLILPSTSADNDELINAVKRRAKREPLQYIVGSVGFYREEYKVTPDCLIPRSDTEILVDYAVKHIPDGESFADLCCGSGCIGISTLRNTNNTVCDSYDVSEGAITLTKENAALNSVSERLSVIKKDLLTDGLTKEYYAILSNPPYIPRSVYKGLESEIFAEPEIAFIGGEDGLLFYKRLIPVCINRLKNGGFIAFEIGYDQGESLRHLAAKHGCSFELIKDYSGNDRVVILKK